jgi:catecholate siderophore receptor
LKHALTCALAITFPAIATTTTVDIETIETIEVRAKNLSVNHSNAIKTPTPILDVPQSLSILTANEIEGRGITSISQIIDYTPGVNTSQGEGHRDSVVFRGVRSTADFFIDGNRDDVQYYRALYNVEQVEILRGPNALLFGRGGTGGVLNRVSKRAELDDAKNSTYTLSADTFGGVMGTIDTNHVLSDDAALRFNAMFENLGGDRDFYDGERTGFNPTYRYQLSDFTRIDLSYEYVDHERFIDRGIPTGPDGRPMERLQDIVFGDPNNNYHTVKANTFRANIEHQFSENTKGNFNAYYGDFEKLYVNFYATAFNPVTDAVELDGYIDETERENTVISGNIISEFDTGNIEHTLMTGIEYVRTNSYQYRYNPVFSTNGDDRETFLATRPLSFNDLSGSTFNGEAFTVAFTDLNDMTDVDLAVTSYYIQDEIALSEQFDLILGARFDQFDITVNNIKDDEVRSRIDEEVSPRAGFIYKPQENISLYISYSESFLPRSGEQYANINGDNNQLDPDTFTNREVGVKWDFAETLSFTAAMFENEQSSPQTADNDPATLDVIDSQIEGFEMQLLGQLNERFSFSVNFSQLDGEIVNRLGGTGLTPRELPESTFSAWAQYIINDQAGVSFGLTYQDESFINNNNSAVLPSYTRLDLSGYYEFSDDLRVQLHIENATDELYFPNAHSTHQVTVAEPVNAKLKLIGSF